MFIISKNNKNLFIVIACNMSSDKYIVYGWKESNPELVIEEEWIKNRNINTFITKNYYNIDVPLYGIKLPLNYHNYNYDISNQILDVVRKAYNQIINFNNQYNLDDQFLGIHLASDFNYKDEERLNTYIPIV